VAHAAAAVVVLVMVSAAVATGPSAPGIVFVSFHYAIYRNTHARQVKRIAVDVVATRRGSLAEESVVRRRRARRTPFTRVSRAR
jgi:hypothetical protein